MLRIIYSWAFLFFKKIHLDRESGGLSWKIYKLNRLKICLNMRSITLFKKVQEEGFNFLIKLINEYESKRNTFSKTGECLYGIFRGDTLIGIGGLNQDPYTKVNKIGRLRRFYISKDYRRIGLGKLLLKKLLRHAEKYFHVVVLHSDTKQGDEFYSANGFVKIGNYKGSSHLIRL